MLIQVDWYKETGKWAYETRVEVDALSYDSKEILLEVIKNQREIMKGWKIVSNYYVVTSDIPESQSNPNYRTTFSRLYCPEKIKEIVKDVKE